MAIEPARAHALTKPWGVVDLRPWSKASHDGRPIGEIWFERADTTAVEPSLLIKLLFTNEPLSIQVHPDDAFAQSIGLPSGKTEAWYVLSAAPGAKVAIGLNQRQTPQQLREAIEAGTLLDLVRWQTASPNDIFFVPARTVHAIGAGIVIAEIQQRSDVTFRLFDYGRQRELQIERGIAAADAGPAASRVNSRRLTDQRALLVANAHFVVERIDLAPGSVWRLEAARETWFLGLKGGGRVGSFDVGIGDAIFAQLGSADIQCGPIGMVGLAAYTGGRVAPRLLHRVAPGPQEVQELPFAPARQPSESDGRKYGRLETTQ